TNTIFKHAVKSKDNQPMNDEEVKLHAEGHGAVFTQIELSNVSVRFYFPVCLLAFQPKPAALPSSLVVWMVNPSAVSHPSEVEKACLEVSRILR
ncbi:hypothetical protein Tco_0224418, partial [Tanacetum coccineum]